jgi:hypothetical protein
MALLPVCLANDEVFDSAVAGPAWAHMGIGKPAERSKSP